MKFRTSFMGMILVANAASAGVVDWKCTGMVSFMDFESHQIRKATAHFKTSPDSFDPMPAEIVYDSGVDLVGTMTKDQGFYDLEVADSMSPTGYGIQGKLYPANVAGGQGFILEGNETTDQVRGTFICPR